MASLPRPAEFVAEVAARTNPVVVVGAGAAGLRVAEALLDRDPRCEAQEKLGDTKYFTAVYPDYGVAPACVTCHNDHKDSPKHDFKIGDVMGAVVNRIPLGT